MEYRIERDSIGEVRVSAERLWGAQTQRSYENFPIGHEKMPREIIRSLAMIKAAAADVNRRLGKLDAERAEAIERAALAIAAGDYGEEFPLKVWQTGSGTQSNMNVNEVIAHICAGKSIAVHPNDHVNMSQSSNDTFPAAMNIAAVLAIKKRLFPALDAMRATFAELEKANEDVIKIGRTHLMDAVPLRFSQEISAWRTMTEEAKAMLESALPHLRALALGGTAVGTGLNCPEGFDAMSCEYIGKLTEEQFFPAGNKFHALSAKDAFVFAHGGLKALAANLMKIANDIRWLASGPRCGLGEISIPANEPGSSIMPGKVNPTQCEALSMVAVQVMGNDAAIGIAASQGNFQLNVYMPLIAYNMLQSVELLADAMESFERNCLRGLKPNRDKMDWYLNNSLMLVTCLSPRIGYENAAKAAKLAFDEGLSLKEAVLKLGYMDAEDYDKAVRPEAMV